MEAQTTQDKDNVEIWNTQRAQERLEQSRELADELEGIEGVEYAGFASLAKFAGYQVGHIELTLSGDIEEYVGFIPDESVRSVSQRISHIIRANDDIADYEFTNTPTLVESEKKAYDENLYLIDIYFH